MFSNENTKPKSKGQLLLERLERIKQNSLTIMQKMDCQINSMQQVKNDLNDKSVRMTEWTNKFQAVITEMGERMFNPNNPLLQNCQGGSAPKKQSMQFVCKKMLSAKRICVLTGAGVSKNCGIPTFRDKDGLYSQKFKIKTQNKGQIQYAPEQFLTLKTFEDYPQAIWQWCNSIRQLVCQKNPGAEHELIHQICLQLHKNGSQVKLITTNIDSLHYKLLQSDTPNKQAYQLHEIHGNFRKYLCSNCRNECKIGTSINGFNCQRCKSSKLRPYVMFFDERYDDLFDPTNLRNQQFDLAIIIGTSLQTGLSLKLVSSSKVMVEINPKCVIKSGEVYQFEEQCEQVLARMLTQLKIQRGFKNS